MFRIVGFFMSETCDHVPPLARHPLAKMHHFLWPENRTQPPELHSKEALSVAETGAQDLNRLSQDMPSQETLHHRGCAAKEFGELLGRSGGVQGLGRRRLHFCGRDPGMIGLMIRPSHLDAPGQQPKREIGMMDPSDPHNLHDTADHEVLETIDIATEGNDCDECVRRLREPLLHVKGVKQVKADPAMERVRVIFDARKTHAPELHDVILRSGYKPAPTAD
jgi:copper chaperone CopZ